MRLILCLLAALTAAAHADPRNPKPDWIDGKSVQYPHESYLLGVGEGDGRQSAEDRARGEIAKIFSSQVNVNTNLTETESNASSGGKAQKNDFQQSISNSVQTISQKALEGVEIVEKWQDQATRQFYALAVLDRQKAILAVKDKLAEFDKEAVQWKSQLDAASEKLPRVKAALKLLAVLKAREDVNAELRVLDPGGKSSPSPVDAAAVRPQAAKALSELDVVVAMSGDAATQVKTGIVKGLNGFGMQAKSGGEGDILVHGEVATQQMEGDGSKWRWARSTVTVSLKDGKTDKVISAFDVSDRQASADYKEAVRRVHVSLAKKVAGQLNEAITAYFENQ
ncbi:MAG: LPP20 family lipoprotein [Elusimicrobia bacterium]|nr:LPP20 family lipoprotein [Elusimicrobiota bacterium]